MIESIIFDLGGILVQEKGPIIDKIIASKLKISLMDLDRISTDLKLRSTSGEITLLEYYREIVSRNKGGINPEELLNIHLSKYKELSTSRDPKIINLFGQIKKNYNLACLTNTEIEIAQFNRKGGLFDYFGDNAFLSTEMKKRKPQPEIYLEVAKRLNCDTKECLFIDDKKKYVESAISLGMEGIVYKNAEQITRELKRHNIKLD